MDAPTPLANTGNAIAEGATRGRLFGRNVLEALFRATPDEDLFLGELLVGSDEATGRRYLFRVVDVSYGTEHREPGWAERVAGTLLADDARGEAGAHTLHEQAKRTYRLAECRCLGYLAPPSVPGGARTVFRKPKSLPTQFSRVVSPAPEDFAFLARRMGDLPVGHLRSGETVVQFPVGIPGRSLASHIGIFATTGMGKSNLLQVLCAGVMAANGRYGLLVIDPHGEHRGPLGRHPWAGHALRTYADRRLPNTSTLRISLAELSVDDLRTAYEWSRPQEEALYELERHYAAELPATPGQDPAGAGPAGAGPAGAGPAVAGRDRTSRRAGLAWLADFARVQDLAGFRDVELSARVALSTLQVVHRRARRIVELRCISSDPAVSVGRRILDELLEGKVVLVDVSGLGGTEEVLVASYLTRRVLEQWQGAFLDDPEGHQRLPVVAIALEEAQRVLSASKDRESNVFPRVAREGRKFGVGLLAVTQQPKLLDDELLSQFNTFFVLGLADERDRNILRSSAKQDMSALGPEIQALMPGECLVVNLAAPFAVPASLYLYDEVAACAPPAPVARELAPPNVSALVD
ncbi:MAG TPA: ATP-binding protein [Acidimicrobiales bacterium]|nr:ATP-binding protein [Acidimicrobiales bacterium]